jgi:hypothetical protein
VNAGELIDYVRTLLGAQAGSIPTGHLLNLLNVAQEEVSREAKLPRKVVQYDELTAANQLVLPEEARKESLIAVYKLGKNDDGDVESSRSLRIMDFVTASREHPNWTTWDASDATKFIMYDPAHDPDCPRPVPGPSSEFPGSFRVIYVVRPNRLSELTDLPFSGKFIGLMSVLAYRVAYLVARDPVMLREYERAINALAGQARPPSVIVRNPLYAYSAPDGTRG